MANKMLIDATHPEETRVVVLRGNRVEEFDFESASRKQLRGNIYLAKVTRVEPSLQAAFVDYGGNRHGFLAFSEIHPDYYQIPVADRQALIDEEQRAQRDADDEIDRRSRRHRGDNRRSAARRDKVVRSDLAEGAEADPGSAEQAAEAAEAAESSDEHAADFSAQSDFSTGVTEETSATSEPETAEHTERPLTTELTPSEAESPESAAEAASDEPEPESASFESTVAVSETVVSDLAGEPADHPSVARESTEDGDGAEHGDGEHGDAENGDNGEEVVESVGGADALEEVPDRAPRYRRQYKIQEVIKRRQVMLVQVVKEERGTKGAALTTYLSLAGRYSVLMPNTARGGGISRKITSGEDRSRLKEIAQELEVPEGMGVILRTAGASRTKTEIKRDFEYLLRLWETVRDLTLKSTAPKLVYEEGSLVKRSIRDLYSKEIDEVIVAGSEAFHEAKDFMRMLMPSHAKNVKLYAETQPLLSRYGVENQLDAMFSPVVQLRSGGYIVINQAEALVAIDVNSGRATREHHIEDTALKTNLEASDEIARQLRLRDLAGLIVIDFIDMDEMRNNRSVERRMKECLKQDRARIQVGRISHFGLLEMSRQRIRTSVLESSTEKCPYCGGSGHVRSVSSLALQVLRALEEQLMRGGTHNLIARTRPDVALYVLNQKRAHLRSLEERYAITITIAADESVVAPQAFVIERGEQVHTAEAARAIAEQAPPVTAPLEEEDDLEDTAAPEAEAEDAEETETETAAAESEPREDGGRRRKRRRRGRGRENGDARAAAPHDQPHGHEAIAEASEGESFGEGEAPAGEESASDEPHGESQPQEREARGEPRGEPHGEQRRRRRRGRRGGQRNRHDRERNGESAQDSNRHGPQMPEPAFAADELDEPAHPEAELSHAVADLDAAPPADFIPPAAGPVEAAAPPPPPPSAESEPRRRSTVREPAPIGGSSADTPPPAAPPPAAPAPEPVITEVDETVSSKQPRRSGWWSRRFAGG
ncbi:MAG: Rne/Rng family ribonuclease [Xanthobacteraceae bacterium]